MKISLNWVKQFTEVPLGIDELVEKIGRQLGAVEEVIDLGRKYEGIRIAKVVSCEKHTGADKLTVCRIDDGGAVPDMPRDADGYVQVVCGAPNVKAGMLVVWLPPGATVPATVDKDPLVLEAREIRGQLSNGMLASSQELALSDNHAGIVEVDIDLPPGTSFAEAYELNDYIIDIENKMFTHRPDCFGILGVAREIAGIQQIPFKSPDWYLKSLDRVKPGKTKLPLEVRNELPDLVPRFMAVAMADVSMKPSPLIIQSYLSRVGLKPINNIVDVTNYLMVLTGQPLHAYDYDKVAAKSGGVPTLVARTAAVENIRLLNGKTFKLDEPAVVIATDKEAIGIGGVMGGADTEVDENTKNIIIECANFDMYSIRRTSMKYGLFTDAVTRFNKGQSPLQNDIVLEEAVATIQYVSGAHVASDVFDLKQNSDWPAPVTVSSEFINARLGLKLADKEIDSLLKNVEFESHEAAGALCFTVPFWRTDIEIPEDVVEEIGRLHGYDKLPVELPLRSIRPVQRDSGFTLKTLIRDRLSQAGANEVLTYSFVHGNLLDKTGQDKKLAYELSNAISPDLQYYRLSLTPSLLDKIHMNIKAGCPEFALYEIGKVHMLGQMDPDDKGVPLEDKHLAMVFAADQKTNSQKYAGSAYYQAKRYLQVLLPKSHIEPLDGFDLSSDKWGEQLCAPYEPKRSGVIIKDGQVYGVIGEFRRAVGRSMKLPEYTAGFEISTELLGSASGPVYQPISRFPAVRQDITLKVPADIHYRQLKGLMDKELADLQSANCRSDLQPVDIYQAEDDPDNRRITFGLNIASYDRTLTDQEVNALLDELASRAGTKFKAERI